MTSPTRTTPVPAGYLSGHCAVRNHRTCRGTYASALCGCDCHEHVEALLSAEAGLRVLVDAWHHVDDGQRQADLRAVINELGALADRLGATS